MIKASKRKVVAKGSGVELMKEYAHITRSLIDAIAESGAPREVALQMVAEAHRIGSLTEQEVNEEVSEAMRKCLMKAANALGKDIEDGGEADE